MPYYSFQKHGDTVYVIDRDTNRTIAVVTEDSISADPKTLQELKELKATNESVQDFVRRSAEGK